MPIRDPYQLLGSYGRRSEAFPDPVEVSAALLRVCHDDIRGMVEAAIRIQYGPDVLERAHEQLAGEASAA